MIYRLLADATVIAHMGFVAFVLFGGLLVLRWPQVAWAHVPAAVWGAWIEFAGWICPLTPLENWLRERGGEAVYASSFTERYILPLLYPDALTREMQLLLGSLVVVVNAALYVVVLRRTMRARSGRRRLRRR